MTDTETAKEKIAAWRAIPVKTATADPPLSCRPRVVPRLNERAQINQLFINTYSVHHAISR